MPAARAAAAVVFCAAISKLLLHLYAGGHYGYFVDELYYLACSRHLAWGYVDQPPLIAVVTWAARMLLGESLFALRLFPALAGTAMVLLTALLARQMGGGRFAQALAAITALVAPGLLAMDGLLSMNAFEPLFWLGCASIALRIWKTGNQRLWLAFGAVAGLGLLNKYSMGMFAAGLVLGILLGPGRRDFARPWIWMGGLVALLIFLPNLLWNVQHHFPFLELQANIRRSGRDVPLGPISFFTQQMLLMLPLSVPVWGAGLWFYFGSARGKPYRALGWAWVFTALAIVLLSPRVYYLWPAFPVLFAAGGTMWESWLGTRFAPFRWGYVAIMAAAGAVLAPMAIPLLPVETYLKYARTVGLGPPKIETHRLGPLPQIYADQFGWPEMVATVARVYNGLAPEVRARTAIFGQNYGQAGAIDLFGPKYGLPPAISGHQSYFLWGPHGYTGESMIVMAGRKDDLERRFASVERVARVEHPYSMPYEHIDVFYCRGLKPSLAEIWPQVKRWD
jgi:hypothetical protein